MLKIGCLLWGGRIPNLLEASKELNFIQLKLRSLKDMEDLEERESFFDYLENQADLVIVYCSTNAIWEEIAPRIQELKNHKKVLCWGSDPALLLYSSANLEQINQVQRYVAFDGLANMKNLLCYLAKEFGGMELEFQEPEELPWQGIYSKEKGCFTELEEYLTWAKAEHKWSAAKKTVGILFNRSLWLNNNTEVIEALIKSLEEKDLNVLPVFSYGFVKPEFGVASNDLIIRQFFFYQGKPCINLLFNLQSFRMFNRGKQRDTEEEDYTGQFLQELGVPVLKGIVPSLTKEEWEKNPHGLGSGVVWHVAMSEFDGVVEPLVIGVQEKEKDQETGVTLEKQLPLAERIEHAAKRIYRWLRLQSKKPEEKKVVFVFHNNPCAGLEATVGGAANLDSIESVALIMKTMQEKGYYLENLPQNGKELIDTIMERKAIGDFRWTPVEEIIQKKGAMALLAKETYLEWWEKCSAPVKEKMVEVWGTPPGEAMVYQEQLIITGVEYGNVLVVVQPKRGCLGAKCDGQACKILHDPDCPPTHQYLASYWYWDKIWGADAIVHVGTHGNLEFLPGKSVGLSGDCYPDLVLGELPHLYIYSVDNPSEGTIAKRRSYATLVDYLIPVMVNSSTYDELRELEDFLAEYGVAKATDPARAHSLEHLIVEAIEKANIHKELKIPLEFLQDHAYMAEHFPAVVKKTHEILTRLRDSAIVDGLHIFGQTPQGQEVLDFISTMLKHDFEGSTSLRRIILETMGLDYPQVINNPGDYLERYQKTNGELMEEAYQLSKEFVAAFIEGTNQDYLALAQRILGEKLCCTQPLSSLTEIESKIKEIAEKIAQCTQEMDNLLLGLEGGYIPSGPSGCPTRGRPEVLPTGRNFFSMDPYTIPTKAAWRVGRVLATRMLEKYEAEEGQLPENCGMVLFAGDMMYTNGEQTSQMLYLLGVEPIWASNGRIKDLRVIPLKELKRPRIDLTIRISSITRDCFPMTVELIDKAVKTVAALDEPGEWNYVRKHTLANLQQLQENSPEQANEESLWKQATSRIFGSRPGTYGSGVNLAVYASAWKDEKDLADIYVYWSGYAYGEDKFGEEAQDQFINQLRTVNVTFRNNGTDEKDLFGCCCHFSYQGGLTAAANVVSGKKVKTYYGDTRDPQRPQVVDLADEIRRVVRSKILNPQWIEGMKRHGYKGAGDIAKRVGRIYGWEATTQEVDDWIFDDLTKTFMLNEENKQFFEENNPWALEEIGRRLLEAEQRGLWEADPEVLNQLKETYLEVEGWLEERMGDVEGEFQGGSIDIMNMDDVEEWGAKIAAVREKIHKK